MLHNSNSTLARLRMLLVEISCVILRTSLGMNEMVKQGLWRVKFNSGKFNSGKTIARFGWAVLLSVMLSLSCIGVGAAPAWAGLNDDHYDGNIFALYAGNGSIFPPRVTLAEAFQRDKPIILSFFVDDSRDCKEFSTVLSQVDAFYGRAANLIPVNVDAIPPKERYTPTEPGYYYEGFVPQTVIIDQSGQVVFNEAGSIAYERIDDVLREVFDLLPRSESVELKRRPVNEFNSELVQ